MLTPPNGIALSPGEGPSYVAEPPSGVGRDLTGPGAVRRRQFRSGAPAGTLLAAWPGCIAPTAWALGSAAKLCVSNRVNGGIIVTRIGLDQGVKMSRGSMAVTATVGTSTTSETERSAATLHKAYACWGERACSDVK